MVVLRGMISIQNIEKSFSGNPVLQDVSFDIPDGKICGVFGKSGIGKSTLAKVLCGVCPPDAGAVTLDGQTLVSADHPYDRRLGIRIQMVYQQPYATLDPSQKIGAGFTELIRYHRFRPKGEELSLTKEMLDKVGLAPQILAHLPHQISGGEAQTTNNRMELTAVIEALRLLKEPCEVELYSDSKYVIDALSKGWVYGWQKKGWIKSDKKPALNVDLWERLLPLIAAHDVRYHWVKGHAENEYNNRCDELAVAESRKYK